MHAVAAPAAFPCHHDRPQALSEAHQVKLILEVGEGKERGSVEGRLEARAGGRVEAGCEGGEGVSAEWVAVYAATPPVRGREEICARRAAVA